MVKLYTDGACKGNPGPGGWGVWIVLQNKKIERYGGEKNTTNNRMELKAVIEAMKITKEYEKKVIYTDSQYVINGITHWIKKWKENNWLNSKKKPVKNDDLWKILDYLTNNSEIEWIWVKGHSGDIGNEKADFLANLGINSLR